MSKRIIALTLLILVLPLMAQAQEMVSGPGEFPIVEEPITLNILMLGHAIVEDFSTNTFTNWYSERTGINLNFDIAPPNEWQEVLNLTIASGDLPDIIVGFNVDPSTLALFGPQGLFLPLSGLIEEQGHYIHEVFETSPQVRPLITSPDGEIYGLPQVNECYHCFYSQRAWINSDWLENVGMDVPQTTEEFVDVLTAFKEQDANGNGDPDDEIPLAAATTGWNPTIDGFLMNPFVFSEFTGQTPGPNRYFEMNDGVITENVTSEGYRDGLKYLNRLYSLGLFGEESFTQPMDQIKQQVEGGDAPTIGVVISGAHPNFANIGGDRWKKYIAVPSLEGPTGLRQAPFNPWGVGSGQCTINSQHGTPDGGFQVVRWLVRPRERHCALSLASRNGKQLKAKRGNGNGRKKASHHLAATNSHQSGVACPLSVRFRMCTGRSADPATAPITCAWARFAAMTPLAWKWCSMRRPKPIMSPTPAPSKI